MNKILLLGIFMILLVSGCGSSNGGGTAMFNTVNASVSVDSSKITMKSDLAKWTGTRCTSDATATSFDDLVNFTLTSTASIKNGVLSPLKLQTVTLKFEPTNTSITPWLPEKFAIRPLPLGGTVVPPGGSVTVPVQVVSHNLKDYFINDLMVLCTPVPVYEYFVTATFDAVEVNTGKTGTLTSTMTVQIADFADN